MKKSILSLALAVIMVMALLTVGAFADGTTLTVGEGETYETISAALADAHDGDTIYIKNGTYEETVTITGKALTLEGESQDGVTIKFVYDERNTTAQYAGTPCYPIVSSDSALTIKNLTIAGPTSQHHGIGGVYASADLTMDYVTVKDIRCTADGGYVCGVQYGKGIMVDGTGNVSITNCKISDFQKCAIDVNTTGTVIIDNNVIEGVGSQQIIAQNGIVARAGNVTISNNKISDLSYTADNEWKYGSTGIYPLGGVASLTIKGNSIDNVDGAMYLDSVAEEVLANAQISGNIVTNLPAPVSNETTGSLYANIQDAVDAAHDGDTIVVAPGTYNGVVEFGGKSLTLKAQYPAYENGGQQMDEDKLSEFTGTFYTGASSASDSFNENQSITIEGFALSGDGLKIGTTNWSTLGNLTVRHCTMTFGNNLQSSNIYNKPNKFIYVNGGANGAYANFVVEDNYISGQPQQDQYPLQLWGVKSAVVSNNTFMLTGAENHQAIGISKLAADASVTVTGNVINGAGGGIYVTTWKCNGDNSDFVGTVNIANNKMYGAGGSYYPVFVGYDGTDYGAFNGTLTEDNNTNNGAPVAAEVGQKPGSTEYFTVTVMSGNSVVDAATVESGTEYTLPNVTNSGYIFLGWRDNNNVTHKAGEVVTITADTTFTAVWGNLPDVKPSEPETPETPVFPFYDVSARDWYYSAVKYVYEKGLMDGVDVGVFAPNDTLTRAMVWTIIARAEGVDTTGGATWYAKAQEWVTAKGISDGENPSAAITRQELVTMLYRLAGEPAVSGTITAPDASSVSTWAQSAMTWAMNIGLVEGDENGAVTPTATATRAQAAALIMRYLEA